MEASDVASPKPRSPLVKAILEPIAPGAPCGDDVTYDDAFQQMKLHIDNLESASGEVDFERVVALGKQILSEKSKDLRVACYLNIALTRTDGISGLVDGVAGMRALIENFWDDLYPAKSRMRARSNALQSLSDRLKDWITTVRPGPDERDSLEGVKDDLRAIQKFCLDVMDDQAPALSGSIKAIEDALRRAPAVKEEPSSNGAAAEASSQADQRPSPSRPDTTAAAMPSSAEGPISPADAERMVARVAASLQDRGLDNPIPYKLVRALRWGDLTSELPNDDGSTQLPPPPSQRSGFLQGLLDSGEHRTLIREAEEAFREYHFWLDPQRYAVAAMEGLGGSFVPARDAVIAELAGLLTRVPRLPRLKFKDGTPFASTLTQTWIEDVVLASRSGTDGGQRSPVFEDGSSHIAELYEEAIQVLAKSDVAEAVALMQEGQELDTSRKERFLRKLSIARLCLRGGQAKVSRPLLEDLDAEIDSYGLESWDPILVFEVRSTLYKCYRMLAEHENRATAFDALNDRMSEVFDKLCRLDARSALSLSRE